MTQHAPSADADTTTDTTQRRSLFERLVPTDPVDLVLQLTLIMILLFGGIRWYHRGLMQMLALCGLISRPLSRHPVYWITLGLINLSLGNLHNWSVSDNHKWLFSYWYLAIGLSLFSKDTQITLATNARLLIGLTFLFAALRKALSSEYTSGAAFRFLLQMDSRFFEPAKAIAGHTQNPRTIWRAINELEPTIQLATSNTLESLAMVLTWWTLAIETAIAAAFLLSTSGRVKPVGQVLLLLFVLTTYPIAPVLGFAWVLLVLNLTQNQGTQRKAHYACLIVLTMTLGLQGERMKVEISKLLFGTDFFR